MSFKLPFVILPECGDLVILGKIILRKVNCGGMKVESGKIVLRLRDDNCSGSSGTPEKNQRPQMVA